MEEQMGRARRRSPKQAADPDYMLSLARGLQVIRAFGHDRPVLSIAEVARLTSMSRAAARRCLHTLSVLGYVGGAAGRYALSPRVLALGYAYLGSAPVAQAAQPVLERVAERLHESCSLTVLDGDEIVYVARAATRRILSVGLAVGSRLPAYCTSMGRVLLAFAGDAERSVFLSRVRPLRHTPHTIVDRSELAAVLGRVRSAGYALVDQELEIGLRSIAVPVRRPDQTVVAAMNVGAQATRVECETMTREYLPVLLDAAEQVGLTLAHRLP
jgi:IclR family transcriptional regulator, pca regulon regulatory protein